MNPDLYIQAIGSVILMLIVLAVQPTHQWEFAIIGFFIFIILMRGPIVMLTKGFLVEKFKDAPSAPSTILTKNIHKKLCYEDRERLFKLAFTASALESSVYSTWKHDMQQLKKLNQYRIPLIFTTLRNLYDIDQMNVEQLKLYLEKADWQTCQMTPEVFKQLLDSYTNAVSYESQFNRFQTYLEENGTNASTASKVLKAKFDELREVDKCQ